MLSYSFSYSRALVARLSSQVMAADLGVRGRDGEIRTRGLLLPKHQKRSFLFLILHPNSDIIAGRGIQ